MNERNELFGEVGASDALRLCNALGWSGAEFCGIFKTDGATQFKAGVRPKRVRTKQTALECSARARAYYIANRERILARQKQKRRATFEREMQNRRGETAYSRELKAKLF